MTDIEIAKANLAGHSICLCKNGDIITDDGRGISPMEKTVARSATPMKVMMPSKKSS